MRRLVLLGCLPAAALLHAQTYVPRVNTGARLEPQGVMMHGAGQDPTGFANYWSAMPTGRQPVVYMGYQNLDSIAPNWADGLKAQILNYPGNFVVFEIGLNLSDGVTQHYEAQVAAGQYDTQIGYLIAGLRELATPVYLRIGPEFNGTGWEGYVPGPYIQAFQHVTNLLRAAPDIEVATVWCSEVTEGANDFMDYYPGDSYVDWFGVDAFLPSSFTSAALANFISLAAQHNKPVMMGEETPEGVGAQSGAASWNGWYALFFNFIAATPQVKQFNYIDWNWAYWAVAANEPSWADWGDARLELPTAAYVLNLYTQQLASPVIFSATNSESDFRKLLGYNDTTPPPAPSGLSVTATPGGASVTWTPVADPSGIARYYLYRNGTLLDYWLNPPYTDSSVGLGTSTYTIAAMDRAGNMSPASAPQTVNLTQIQRIQNGGFENGLSGWQFNSYAAGAAGTAVIDSANPIDGSASVKINVTQSTGVNWNLQLLQQFQLTAGLNYAISFKARASAPVSVPFVVQENGGLSTIDYGVTTAAVTTAATAFQYSFTANVSMPVELGFYIDNIGSVTLWLDDISVIETNPGKNPPPSLLASGVQSGASFLPGAVPGSWLAIKGANLATVASDTWANSIVNGALPTSLDGVSVSIGGQAAYIYYVSPGQINAIAPNVSPGPQPLVVTTPAGATQAVTVNVAAQAPAFFLWPGNQAVATRTDGSFAVKAGTFAGATTTAAHPGDVVILWGTGFGATTPAAPQGSVVPSTQQFNCSAPTVTIGTTNATVYGCALSPGAAALYQVAIQVPGSLANGDYPLTVAVNGSVSPAGVILSVSN